MPPTFGKIPPSLPEICQYTTGQGDHSLSTPGFFFTRPILNYCRTPQPLEEHKRKNHCTVKSTTKIFQLFYFSVPGSGSSFSKSSFRKTHSLQEWGALGRTVRCLVGDRTELWRKNWNQMKNKFFLVCLHFINSCKENPDLELQGSQRLVWRARQWQKWV